MTFNFTSYAESAAANSIKRVVRKAWSRGIVAKATSLLIATLSLFLTLAPCIAAPPNPYRFFNVDPGTGEVVPKSPQSTAQFLEALAGCCLARRQSVLQPDGIEYVLALKVDFVDMPGRRSGEEFNQYLFAPTGVSLKTYYRENSYGQMDIQPGPAGGVLPAGNKWVRAQKPMSYYGAGPGNFNLSRYRELIREVCQAVDADVDFSQYDRNEDGTVDHVFLIHAGNDQANTGVADDLWSNLTPNVNLVLDGVLIDTVVVVGEEPDFAKPHLGIYFHEFFHDFGAPDVYGFNWADARDHKWGLMGAYGPYQGPDENGLAPSHIIGYLKWDFDARPENGRLGWIEPVTITRNESITVPSFELGPETDKVFKIDIPPNGGNGARLEAAPTGGGREFFLIENRYKASGATYDTHLPESGILIWHIDETQVRPLGSYDAAQQIWLEDPADPEHLGLAGGALDFIDIKTITDGAAYSADDGQTAFTPGTLPNSSANDGTVTGISITNIGPEGFAVPLQIWFGDRAEPNDTLATAFPIRYEQLYESFLLDVDDTRDVYQLEAFRGVTIQVTLMGISLEREYRLFFVTGTDETPLGTLQQIPTGLQLHYQPEATGTFYLVVESDGGFRGADAYRLQVVQVVAERFTFAETRVYPNPLRAGDAPMKFDYRLAASQTAETVTLEIFTKTGDKVYHEVHRNVFVPGTFAWNGANNWGAPIAPGIYIYRLSATQAAVNAQEIGRLSVIK